MRTHEYMKCPKKNGEPLDVLAPDHDTYNYDCNECERYYYAEIHPDLCEGPDCCCKKSEVK